MKSHHQSSMAPSFLRLSLLLISTSVVLAYDRHKINEPAMINYLYCHPKDPNCYPEWRRCLTKETRRHDPDCWPGWRRSRVRPKREGLYNDEDTKNAEDIKFSTCDEDGEPSGKKCPESDLIGRDGEYKLAAVQVKQIHPWYKQKEFDHGSFQGIMVDPVHTFVGKIEDGSHMLGVNSIGLFDVPSNPTP